MDVLLSSIRRGIKDMSTPLKTIFMYSNIELFLYNISMCGNIELFLPIS